MDPNDKKTGSPRKSGLVQVCTTGIYLNCAKSPRFWRQKYKGNLNDHIQWITIFRYLKKKLLRKSTFLATKMSVNDKNQGNPSKSARHLACSADVHRNCSKSPHFRRQNYRRNLATRTRQITVFRHLQKKIVLKVHVFSDKK